MDTEDNPQSERDLENKPDYTTPDPSDSNSISHSVPDSSNGNSQPTGFNAPVNHLGSQAIDSSPPSADQTAAGSHDTPALPNSPTAQPHVNSSKSKLMGLTKIIALVVIVVGLSTGAYFLGKHHERLVIQAPAPQPINLPPQAIVLNACEPGRGKQYIIPKDIPVGPIYDVENSKVIAVEYNLNIDQLFTNSDTFSDAILAITKNYSVNHFTILPSSTTPNGIHLVMFVVSKAVASGITCSTSSSST